MHEAQNLWLPRGSDCFTLAKCARQKTELTHMMTRSGQSGLGCELAAENGDDSGPRLPLGQAEALAPTLRCVVSVFIRKSFGRSESPDRQFNQNPAPDKPCRFLVDALGRQRVSCPRVACAMLGEWRGRPVDLSTDP